MSCQVAEGLYFTVTQASVTISQFSCSCYVWCSPAMEM